MEKTPISHLQEYLMKRGGALPQYELVHSGSGTKVWFKYELTIANLKVSGEGLSKKEAKHNTAKAMLIKLGQYRTDDPATVTLPVNRVVGNMIETKSSSVHNAIGALNEQCSRNRLPAAKYDLIKEEGPPHRREFTMKCSVGDEFEVSTANTIQTAKHQSAAKMLSKLSELAQDQLISLKDDGQSKPRLCPEQLADIIEKFKISSSLMKQKKLPINTSELPYKDYHLALKLGPKISSTVMNSLAAIIRRKDFKCVNAELEINHDFFLESLLKDLDLKYSFLDIPPHTKSKFPIVALNIHYTIPLSFLGVGNTLSEAKKVASIDAVNWLVGLYV